MRWRLVSTCLLGAWLGATAPAPAAAAPRRATPVVRWQLSLPGWGEPAADDSAAYFLTRTHEVLSIDAATGSIRWRSDTGGAGDVPTGTQVRLAFTRVLVGDGGIVAFDRTSGRHVWRFEAPDGDDPGVFLGAADADLVVAGSPMGRLYAVDAVSGAVRWTRDIAAGRAPRRLRTRSRRHADRRVVHDLRRAAVRGARRVRSDRQAPVDVSVRRRRRRGGPAARRRGRRRRRADRRAHRDGAARVGPTRVGAGPRRVDRRTARGRDIRALASRGDWLVATSLTGPIRAYDVRSRRQRWEYVDSPADAVALRVRVHGDQLYVPYSDGSLVALDLETGAERWRTGDGDPVVRLAACCVGDVDLRDGSRQRSWRSTCHPLETAPRRSTRRPSLKGPRHRCPSSTRRTHQPG